jgi:hypothetical protein
MCNFEGNKSYFAVYKCVPSLSQVWNLHIRILAYDEAFVCVAIIPSNYVARETR